MIALMASAFLPPDNAGAGWSCRIACVISPMPSPERVHAREQHLVEENAHLEDVSPWPGLPVEVGSQLFRERVSQGKTDEARLFCSLCLGEPPVSNFWRPVGCNQDIAGLYVPVDNPLIVGVP